MNRQNDILDDAITRVRRLLENYNVSEEERDSVEQIIEAHRARVDTYNVIDMRSEAEQFYMYMHRSSVEVEQRMILTEKELWTPYTI